MDINKILSADILDIIFEGRNKDYGAYDLRKTYTRRLLLALLFTALFTLLLFGGMKLSSLVADLTKKKFVTKTIDLTEIKEDKKPDDVKPPPPPPKPPPPKIEVTKFTPPKVVKDEEVKPEEKPPEQEKLDNANIGTFNQEGQKDLTVQDPPKEDKGTGQAPAPEKKEEDEDRVFTKVEKEAEYPGGSGAWKRFLEKNLNPNVPVEAGAPDGTYTVMVVFIVDKEGNVSELRTSSNVGYGMEEEALRVLRKATKWTPAEQNGRQVKAYRTQPITFVVQGGE